MTKMGSKSENIEFLRIYIVENLYDSSTNGFTHEIMLIFSLHVHSPPIYSPKVAKMGLSLGSGPQRGGAKLKIFLSI